MKTKIQISINIDEISDNFDEAINFLKTNNVLFTEIRTIGSKNIVNYKLSEVKKFSKVLAKNGLMVSAIASPLFKWYLEPKGETTKHDNYSFNPTLSEKEKKAYILKTIEIAKIFGTKNVRVFSNLKQKGLSVTNLYEDNIFKFMLQKFSDAKISPLLENEPVCLVSKAIDYLEVLQKYNRKGLLAWWDISNSYDIGDIASTELINKINPYIRYLHFKDKISPDGHDYVPLGLGFINYKRILTNLTPSIENKNIFASIETHVRIEKIQATQKSLDYLRQLLCKSRVSYALVGTGRVVKNHINAFRENVNSELLGVYDIDAKKNNLFAKQNDIKAYKTLDQLLHDPLVQVVNICTPHNTHIDIAKKAVNSGKIVLSEKPFAISSRNLQIYLKNRNGADKTYVVFQNLFNKPVQKLINNVEKGRLGNIRYISANIRWCRDDDYFRDWHGKLKISGGSLFNQAIHSIQLILLLVKSDIKDTYYIQKTIRKNSEVEDLGLATFCFKNGVLGNLELCLVNKGGNLESSLYVVGDKGSVKIGGNSLNMVSYEFYKSKNIVSDNIVDNHLDIYGNGHTFLIRTLSNVLLNKTDANRKYLIKAKDVLSVTKFIEKLYGNSN